MKSTLNKTPGSRWIAACALFSLVALTGCPASDYGVAQMIPGGMYPMGATGPKGATGPTGTTGATGASGANADGTVTPTPTPTAVPSGTPTPTATPTASPTGSPTAVPGSDTSAVASVASTFPLNAAVSVSTNVSLLATFNKAMDAATLNASTFKLAQGTTAVSGTVSYSGVSASFTPTTPLSPSTTYLATITNGARDTAGTGMVADHIWSFTTGTQVSQQKVAFGSTLNAYAVLAGSTVTNTGPSIINGDLGVSPGAGVSGFGPGVVNGTIHAGDATAATAKTELTTSYNEAMNRSTSRLTVAGNLGGRTLTPGLYTSGSSLEITSGDLTFDAQGDANAVFIIQMASTLTTTAGRQIILAGGAKAANIFWQVGSSATLGTNSIFKGNILADIAITLETGATLNGRALTRTGAVSLDSATVTIAL